MYSVVKKLKADLEWEEHFIKSTEGSIKLDEERITGLKKNISKSIDTIKALKEAIRKLGLK